MSGSEGDAGDILVVCPGCGLRLPRLDDGVTNPHVSASPECQQFCHELSLDTLSHGDAFFIHQVAVDAYAAVLDQLCKIGSAYKQEPGITL